MANKYYAVRKGKVPGIFESWEACRDSVSGYPGAEFKSFIDRDSALEYLENRESVGIHATTAEANDDASAKVKPYAYVDGSYNPETDLYGYGGFLVVPFSNGSVGRYEFCGSGDNEEAGGMRNVAGEIKAAATAVLTAINMGLKSLTIYHDYTGISAWVDGTWQAKNKQTMAYADFMHEAMNSIEISFVCVRGHTGVEGNEMADLLAKKGAGIV